MQLTIARTVVAVGIFGLSGTVTLAQANDEPKVAALPELKLVEVVSSLDEVKQSVLYHAVGRIAQMDSGSNTVSDQRVHAWVPSIHVGPPAALMSLISPLRIASLRTGPQKPMGLACT